MNSIEQIYRDQFYSWIRENKIISPSSEIPYFRSFEAPFEELCTLDLLAVYQYRQNNRNTNKGDTYLKAMSAHYLRYRLETAKQQLDVELDEIVLLKELLQTAESCYVPLNSILNHALDLDDSVVYTFTKKDSFGTKKGKLTDYGYYYHIQRYAFGNYHRDPELQRQLRENVSRYLPTVCSDPYTLRNDVAKLSDRLQKLWDSREGYPGSGTQQKLLQLASLKINIGQELYETHDFFRSSGNMYAYIAQLLLDLAAGLFESNGTAFPAISLSPELGNYWIWLLALAPFQRITDLSVMFFLNPSRTTAGAPPEISPFVMKLIQNGLLWLSYGPRSHIPRIKMVPCAFTLLADQNTPSPDRLWNRSDGMVELRRILRKLCDEAYMLQSQVLSSGELPPAQELFRPKQELSLILASAPEAYGAHSATLVCLLRVQVNCYLAQTRSHDLNDIVTGCSRLCAMVDKWPDLFRDIPLPISYGHQTMRAGLQQYQTDRILEELSCANPTASSGQIFKYAIFAESSARSSMNTACQENNRYAFIHGGHTRIRALLLQAAHAPRKGTSVLWADYLVPCRQILHACARELLLCRNRADYLALLSPKGAESGTSEELLRRCRGEFSMAAALYNDSCDSIAGQADPALRFPSDVNSLDALAQIRREFDSAVSSIILPQQSFSPIPTAPGIALAGHADKPYRRFHQSWFLSYMDSVYVSREGNDAYVKHRLMTHLLSAQDAVLTVNQIMDNRVIQQLSQDPSFLWMVKTGKVGVSLYGRISNLTSHAASQFEKDSFWWSSLPPVFNDDHLARREAAKYLRGETGSAGLSSEYRDSVLCLAESLRILDEAIPGYVRSKHFQRGQQPNMIEQMNINYDWLKQKGLAPGACSVHDKICAILKGTGFRSDYTRLLDLCRSQDGHDLTAAEQELIEFVSSLGDQKDSVLDTVHFLLDDIYNRMLASTFTTLTDFTYTQQQRELIHFDETKPLTQGGCKLYYQSHTPTDTGTVLDWSALVDRAAAQDAILQKDPGIQPEDMVRILGDHDVVYDIRDDADGTILRTGEVVLRADATQSRGILVQMMDSGDTIYMEAGTTRSK